MASLAWLLSGLFINSLVAGLIVFALLTVSGQLGDIWSSVVLNSHVKSKDRATAISTLSLLVQIPYVFVVLVYSDLIENGGVTTFYYIVAGILLLAALAYYFASRNDRVMDATSNSEND